MKKEKTKDANMEAANEIYAVAQEQANQKLMAMQGEMESVRAESETIGVLKTIDATIAYQELLRALTLYNIKQHKAYKGGGLTWAEFCDAIGMPVRTVDLLLEDLRPIVDNFSATVCQFSGLPLNKIRYLGKTISANLAEIKDGCLIYEGETIPVTPEHAGDIQALIEKIQEEQTTLKEEQAAQKKAYERVQADTHKSLTKLQKEVDKFTAEAEAKGLTPTEDAFLQKIEKHRILVQGSLIALEPVSLVDGFDGLTPRMKARAIATVHELKMQILALYDTTVTEIGDPTIVPEMIEDYENWAQKNGFK